MKVESISDLRQFSKIADIENKKSADLKDIEEEDPKLREASKKLEGQFLSLLIKSMENTIPKDDDSKQSMATMMFSSVMGKEMSANGGIGLADFIYKSLKVHGNDALSKMQESGMYNPFHMATLTGDNDE